MNNALYWLWIQRVFGYSAWIADPIRCFGSARALYEATEQDYRACDIFGKTRSFSRSRLILLKDKDLHYGEEIAETCERHQIQIITPDDDLYPRSLLQLPDYPAVLFVKGDLSCLQNRLSVAVIGSRTPSQYAVTAAKEIAGDLARQNVVIISGGALGIDSEAHKAALQQRQPTLLVMGCGIRSNYLQANLPLRHAISNNGALVSEYPPASSPSPGSFPQRNRIISGLSSGIVIIEAGERSGTLNTATHAKQQNRPLFVLPGDIHSAAFAGSNHLIREGAKTIFSAEDVFSYFDMVYAVPSERRTPEVEPFQGISAFETQSRPAQRKAEDKRKSQAAAAEAHTSIPTEEKNSKIALSKVSKNAALVYNIIIGGKNQMDEIVLCSALPTAKVLSALTELELFGMIAKGEGNYFTVTTGEPVNHR